jgi:hypothetical protein
MSVEIDFGAGQSVTKTLPIRAELRGLGTVGNEVSSGLCVHCSSLGRGTLNLTPSPQGEGLGMRAMI